MVCNQILVINCEGDPESIRIQEHLERVYAGRKATPTTIIDLKTSGNWSPEDVLIGGTPDAEKTVGVYVIAHGADGQYAWAPDANKICELLIKILNKSSSMQIRLRKVCLLICNAAGSHSDPIRSTSALVTTCRRLSGGARDSAAVNGLMVAAYDTFFTVQDSKKNIAFQGPPKTPMSTDGKRILDQVQAHWREKRQIGKGDRAMLREKKFGQSLQKYGEHKIVYQYYAQGDLWNVIHVQQYSDKEAMKHAPELVADAVKYPSLVDTGLRSTVGPGMADDPLFQGGDDSEPDEAAPLEDFEDYDGLPEL